MKAIFTPFFTAFILQLSCMQIGFAQHIISGRITDAGRKPISDAPVLLLDNTDSSVLRAEMTDQNGYYTIHTDVIKNRAVKANPLGYAPESKFVNDKDTAQQTIDFILSPQARQLSEVNIESNKKMLERKTDRIIFNVDKDITTTGSNALEVLKKSPGVMLRQSDNSIMLIGKSNVAVMINDRIVPLSGEDLIAYLQAIPAENISRIEVITAPPAKYDAAGNSGIINIVLKKQSKQGLQGNVRAGYEQASYAKGIIGADMNYRKDKLNVFGNINYTNGSNHIDERLNTPYPQQIFEVHDDYKKTLKPLQYTLGADYQLHKNGTIGIQWSDNVVSRVDQSNSSIHVLHVPLLTLDSVMLTQGGNHTNNSNNVLNLNYTFNIDTSGKKLSVDANGLWFHGRRSNDFNTTDYFDEYQTPTGAYSANRSEGTQNINIKTIQADLELPYKWASLSIGGKLSAIRNISNNIFGSIDSSGFHIDPSVSNSFDYHENVQALYASIQKTVHKWSFQFGLRGEFTQTKGYSQNLNQTNINHYFNIFPTAYIQYQLNDDNVWNINYSKRINRPSYRSLDPYRSYATPYHYNEGNPFLSPSYNNNVELSYTYKSNYSLSAFYQYERNHFASVWRVDDVNHVTSSIYLNFANTTAYGINASANLQPLKWLQIQPQLGIQQSILQSEIYTTTEQSYKIVTYYAALNNAFQLNKSKTLLAECNLFYISKYRDDFLEIQPMGNVDLGFKVLLFEKRMSIALNATDIFASQKARGVHVITGQTIDNYFDTRNVRLTLQYKFGNNTIKGKRDRTLGIEDEKGRVQ